MLTRNMFAVERSFREARPYQTDGLEALRQSIRQGVRRIVLQLPTGAGKTFISSSIASGALSKGRKVAFCVPRIALVDQTIDEFAREGVTSVGVMQADHPLTDMDQPVQVCSADTLRNRTFPDADVVIIDECVTGDTLVSTPFGDRRIDTLRVGDVVENAMGIGFIHAISKRKASTRTLRLSNGRNLTITNSHPVFTDEGWIEAQAVKRTTGLFSKEAVSRLRGMVWAEEGNEQDAMERAGKLLSGMRSVGSSPYGSSSSKNMRRMRKEFPSEFTYIEGMERATLLLNQVRSTKSSRVEGGVGAGKDLRCVREDVPGYSKKILGKGVERAKMLLAILREEIEQPDALSGSSRESSGYTHHEWPCSEQAWRKRTAIADASIDVAERAWQWMDSGIGSENPSATRHRLSDQLQNRHCQSTAEDWDRGRRRFSRRNAEAIGREEGCSFGDIRVEDFSCDEQDGDRAVYNLHVSGHPSYFANGVLVHNCHLWRSIYQKWIEARPDAVFIGLSATPWAKGLGKHFESLLIVATMKDLMEQGYLCQYRAFGVGDPDLSGIKVIAGDYHEGQLSQRMRNDEALVGDVVDTWRRLHGQDRTLVFAVDLAHARVIQERFERAGIRCGYQDASTPNDEREGIKRQFHSGALPVVVSVGTLIIGVDWDVRCISWCRPTKSEMLFVQGFGRGTRLAAPGSDPKQHLVFLDHAGVIKRLGYPEDILYEQLHGGKTEPRKAREPSLPKPCPKCTCMIRGRVCPNCGHEKIRASGVEERDGELFELRRDGAGGKAPSPSKRTYTMAEKRWWHAQLKEYAENAGYKPGWSSWKYKEKFGVWPTPDVKAELATGGISIEVRSWIKSRNIARAKRRIA